MRRVACSAFRNQTILGDTRSVSNEKRPSWGVFFGELPRCRGAKTTAWDRIAFLDQPSTLIRDAIRRRGLCLAFSRSAAHSDAGLSPNLCANGLGSVVARRLRPRSKGC